MRISISGDLAGSVEEIRESIKHQMESRAYRVSNELRNSALGVLRGQRGGRRYKVPGTYRKQRDKTDGKMKRGRYYTASAPGEPPAMRTGNFRGSWQPETMIAGENYKSSIKTDQTQLAEWLENGTPGGQMAPRPHHDRILAETEPKAVRIYSEPYV